MTLTGPAWQVNSLQATGHVAANHALVFDTTLTAQIEMSPQPAQVSLIAHGDAQGIELKELKVTETGHVLTSVTGRLPLAVVMAPSPHLSIDETARLELTASTEPDSPLWATLSAYTGLQLTQPVAKINLKGSLRQPDGELQVSVAQLGAAPGHFTFPLPELSDASLTVKFSRELVTITNFAAKLDGQAVQAGGKLPMDDGHWQQLWRAPAAFDWSKAEARVEIPDADLAPLAKRFPTFVAAKGRLHAHVELAPGGNFSGALQLTDAASRPLASLGSVQRLYPRPISRWPAAWSRCASSPAPWAANLSRSTAISRWCPAEKRPASQLGAQGHRTSRWCATPACSCAPMSTCTPTRMRPA